LTALMGDDESTLPLKRLITERIEGNPFFMEEMFQSLVEQGVLARNGAAKLVKPLSEIRVPRCRRSWPRAWIGCRQSRAYKGLAGNPRNNFIH
jgi:hypothetical protein